MVFSQTSHKTRSLLKVVDIDHLKSNKDQQGNGTTGVITGGNTEPLPSSPEPTTSFSEEFLKSEPDFESAMYHESDCGFFQDLEQWCFDPAKEEQVQTIDSLKVTKERAHNNDTLHTPFSPQDWETFGPSSPAQASMYCITPHDPLSPATDDFVQLDKLLPTFANNTYKEKYQEPTLDFNNMPVVFGDLESEKMADVNTVQVMDMAGWSLPHSDYNKHYTNTQNIMPFFEEDTTDSRLVTVTPGEVENDFTVSRFILGNERGEGAAMAEAEKRHGLSVSIPARVAGWAGDVISTPDIVTYVDQLEKEKCPLLDTTSASQWPVEETELAPTLHSPTLKSPKMEYQPITPNSESQVESENEEKPLSSRKRRHNSEDSDESYTPDAEYTPRNSKRKPKKPNIPIKDMILALEGSQQLKKARRGRPPKRRESTVSVCSIDDANSNVSAQEMKYRELRDKNNEASKRSRMNRKLKELQMEQLVLDLEDRNQKLKVKADILEEMTKKLKDALMTAILQK
ncbi:hypothetical protein ABMA27_001384 [Loxostege sticticalis]|uniref:BZIP domain-containing protein n=1 Tax=Loxostege sticticalis TaxID=481309 RepID=A0ABR3HYA1_LOXSC